jgi:hypothetical protein
MELSHRGRALREEDAQVNAYERTQKTLLKKKDPGASKRASRWSTRAIWRSMAKETATKTGATPAACVGKEVSISELYS